MSDFEEPLVGELLETPSRSRGGWALPSGHESPLSMQLGTPIAVGIDVNRRIASFELLASANPGSKQASSLPQLSMGT